MFYLYLLIALAILAAVIFSAPLRLKVWMALGAVGIIAIAGVIPAAGVLLGGRDVMIVAMQSPLFGAETLAIDPLSAFMLIVISIAGIATTLYSRGYLEHYLNKKSSAHISLHYFSLVVMVLSMMMVVV